LSLVNRIYYKRLKVEDIIELYYKGTIKVL